MSEKLLYGNDLLRALSLAFGPTGCEGNVAELINSQIKDFADSVTLDKMGNLTAVLFGTDHGTDREHRLMFSAHMDEVGFMITNVNSDGTLKFSTLGGIVASALPARRVTVGDENNRIKGVIGTKAIHQLRGDDREAMPKVSDLYIDIGAKDKADAEGYVKRGDFGTFDSEYIRFGSEGKFIKGKALDDRFGCCVMIELCRRLHARRQNGEALAHDVYFAFTVCEEIGKSGAGTSAYRIDPQMAFVLEATAVADNTGAPREKQVANLGHGPAISFMDRSTIYARDVYDFVLETAKKNNIKAQPKRYVSGGNDAGHIHQVRAGVRVAAISAPARYIHTASDVIHADDYASTLDLTEALAVSVKL